MPARSQVKRLPREVRARIDQWLIERGFSGYSELADWLQAQGHDVNRSAVHRYGQEVQADLEEELRAIRIATAEATAVRDVLEEEGGGSIKSEAALGLVQEKIFGALRELKDGATVSDVAKAATAIEKTARAQIAISRERREGRREATEEAIRVGRQHGLTRQGEAAVRGFVEGLG